MTVLPLLASAGGEADATARILLALAVIVVAAKLGGEVMERIGQPAVLGELGVGLLLGNLAVAGVVAPMALGYGVGVAMKPDESWMLHAFLGAMLAATSVGITARVLKDVDALKTPAARIILGAAVIDDVLGLLVLAVVSGIIRAAATGEVLGAGAIVVIVVKACLFLVGALAIGSFL